MGTEESEESAINTAPAHDAIDFRRTQASVRALLFGGEPTKTKIGRFVVTGTAGAGQMGRVYIGHDPDLDRKVAIKVIADDADPTLARRRQKRLVREAKAIAKLSHPNVVSVHEVGRRGDDTFIVMEYVEGQTLRAWLRARPRTVPEVVPVMIAAGRGLAAAHAAGLVHRDFKPDNVMIAKGGRVVVLDFGLARTPSETPDDEITSAAVTADTNETLTQHGGIVGTPGYMAPEQIEGGSADPRSDQFAFCVTMFEALHGDRPWNAATWPGLRAQLVTGLKRGRRPVPDWLHEAMARGLSSDRSERHRSMAVLVALLAKRRVSVWAYAGFGLGVAVVGGAGALAAAAIGDERPCNVGEAPVAAVWNDDARATVEERAATQIDTYVQRWLAARRDACEATHVRHEQSEARLDHRIACLDRRLTELDALLHALADPESRMANALPATYRLPSIEPCDDPDYVEALTPPTELSDAVNALRDGLAQARVLSSLHAPDTVRLQVQEIVAAADELGHAPLQADARFELGRILVLAQDPAAERTLLDAVNFAEASGHDRASAAAWCELVSAVAQADGAPQRAELFLERAEAAVRRVGSPPSAALEITIARGIAAHISGKPDDARRHIDAAAQLAEQAPNAEHRRIQIMQWLGKLSWKQRDYARSKAYYETVEEAAARLYGPDHDVTLVARCEIAMCLTALGKFEKALAIFEVELPKRRAIVGDVSPSLLRFDNGVAVTYARLGRLDDAVAQYKKALALAVGAHGGEDSQTVRPRSNLALSLVQLQRYDEAIAHAQEAMRVMELSVGPKHPSIAEEAAALGSIYLMAGRRRSGIELLRRAVKIQTEHYGVEHTKTARTKVTLADALRVNGSLEEAKAVIDAAWTVLESELGTHHKFVGDALHSRGQILGALGRFDAAVESLERAVEVRSNIDGPPAALAESRWVLALALSKADRDGPRQRALARAAIGGWTESGSNEHRIEHARSFLAGTFRVDVFSAR